MPCSIRTPVALALALAACGSDTAGDELPPGAFTTGPGAETSSSDASADDDPSVTLTNTTPSDTSNGDDTTSSTGAATTTDSETTSPLTADTSTTESTDPSTTESTSESRTESTSTTDPTDPSTDTGPVPVCGDGDPVVGEVCLQPAEAYAMGLAPADIVLGDFDGDGDLDVATANEDSDDVSVRLGNGDGTFGAEDTFAVGTQPVALAVARFDAGTDDDLAVVNRGSNDVSILLADGAGGFAPATSELVGTTPVDLGIGPINDDTDVTDDIVVLNQSDGDYTVLLSEGDGTFTTQGPFASNTASPSTIALQSYNSGTDNNLDVFVLGGNQYFGSPGNGLGFIDDGVQVMGMIANANIVRASTARIDAGNTWDIAVVEDTNDRVLFLLGNGAAAFQQVAANVDTDPTDVVAIDVDGDDVLDAVVAQGGADSIAVVPFAAIFDDPVAFAAGTAPSAVAAADLDGDTIPDVVVANAGSDDISVLLSDP